MKNIGTQYTFTSQTRLNDGSDRVGQDQVGLFLSFLDLGHVMVENHDLNLTQRIDMSFFYAG
jgi:hypothetical protein